MKHAVVLDIGSSKIVSICAGRVGKDGMAVYGADIRPYAGYRFGAFADEQDLAQAIKESLEATQRECGFRFREVAVCVPAPFTIAYLGKGEISFESRPKRITGADIDMLINTSLPEETPEGYTLMHSTPFCFKVDGAQREELPADIIATSIKAQVSHVYASDTFLNPVYTVLEQIGACSMCISSPLSTALMLIPGDERRHDAVLVDIGFTHTDVSVVRQSALIAQETIEVGGMHFAGDLAYGLNINRQTAELVKRRYVFGLDYQDSVELLRTPEGTRSVERTTIQFIIEERAKELCELIGDALNKLDVSAVASIYLTGGGISMMRGSCEFMEQALNKRISRDMPWMPRMNSPNYASAFGALEFVLHTGGEDALMHNVEVGVLRRLREFFVK